MQHLDLSMRNSGSRSILSKVTTRRTQTHHRHWREKHCWFVSDQEDLGGRHPKRRPQAGVFIRPGQQAAIAANAQKRAAESRRHGPPEGRGEGGPRRLHREPRTAGNPPDRRRGAGGGNAPAAWAKGSRRAELQAANQRTGTDRRQPELRARPRTPLLPAPRFAPRCRRCNRSTPARPRDRRGSPARRAPARPKALPPSRGPLCSPLSIGQPARSVPGGKATGPRGGRCLRGARGSRQ